MQREQMLAKRLSRIGLALLAVLVAAGIGAARASACGTGGYSYAGVAAPAPAFGISAVVTPLGAFDIRSGHVAGWVGVGGVGLGPNGSDEWLQVGFASMPDFTGHDLYYELTQPGGAPTYHRIAGGIPAGRAATVAVVELAARPNFWRVLVDGKPVTKPILLPQSHGRWAPIATAEAWDGGDGTCNDFLYRFRKVSIASVPGGGWQPLVGGSPITSSSTRLARPDDGASFVAAEGAPALRSVAAFQR